MGSGTTVLRRMRTSVYSTVCILVTTCAMHFVFQPSGTDARLAKLYSWKFLQIFLAKMTLPTYLPTTYLPTYLPTHPPTRPLPTYQPTSQLFYSLFLDLGRFFSFLILYTIGRTPWTRDQHVARPLPTHRTIQTKNKRTQTSMR
jgi:hypothetical protein